MDKQYFGYNGGFFMSCSMEILTSSTYPLQPFQILVATEKSDFFSTVIF